MGSYRLVNFNTTILTMLLLLPICAIIHASSSKSLNPVINTFTELNDYLNILHENSSKFKSEHLDRLFVHYKNVMNKSGHGTIKVTNKNQLQETLNKIIEHNNDPSKSNLYKIGLNQFSHLSREEIVQKMSLKKTKTPVEDNESKSKKLKRKVVVVLATLLQRRVSSKARFALKTLENVKI